MVCRSGWKSTTGPTWTGSTAVIETAFELAYPLALRAVQVRATMAVANVTVPAFEREDLEQEGLTACWRALPQFDPNRASLRTFVELVVASRLASVIRSTRRIPPSEPIEPANDPSVRPDVSIFEMRTDVCRVLNLLTKGDRRLALLLMKYSPTEVSRRLGVGRSTVYERMRKLRPRFVRAGLGPRGPNRLRAPSRTGRSVQEAR